MIKKWSFWLCALVFSIMVSCSVNTESTYYKDSASGMNVDVKMDKMLFGMMKSLGKDSADNNRISDLKHLTTEWKNLYDLAKEKGKVPKEKSDSAKVMKKIFMKINKENDEISGFSFKYDKLLPHEIAMALNPKKKDKALKQIGSWDGKQLTLKMADLSPEKLSDLLKNDKKPVTKEDSLVAAGSKMAEGMLDMLKLFEVKYKNRLKFESKIKNISGKHDFLKQIDDRTLELSYSLKDFTDGKNLKNQDKKIIITTE